MMLTLQVIFRTMEREREQMCYNIFSRRGKKTNFWEKWKKMFFESFEH